MAQPTVKNQLSGVGLTYDAAGNVIRDNLGMHYTYDAEGRVVTAGAETYSYDGDGKRIRKSAGGDSGSTYFYGANGEVTDEQTVHLNPGNGFPGRVIRNLYFNGQLVYRMGFPDDANDVPSYYIVPDQVGSSRATVDTNGNKTVTDYYPFGSYIDPPPTSLEQQFTGKERDTESGLDYFGARYYGSSMGRFMSPDYSDDEEGPVSVPFYNPSNPQSLNLYSYTRNNPLTGTDPDGHDCVVQTRTSDTTESVSTSAGNCDNVKIGDGQSKSYVPGTVTSITAGAGGNSIDVGYTPYSGGGDAGVSNLNSAPTPDRPGLAYNFGNNAQGYQMLGTASHAVNTGAAIAVAAYGAAFFGPLAYEALAAGAEGEGVGLTEHGAQRLAQRGISPEQAKAAIQAAKQAGNVVSKIGKYGTPQSIYTANGIRVVVEEAGANAGKIITAFFK